MQYSMLENGMDFIISGILHLQKAESENAEENIQGRELKYAFLHWACGHFFRPLCLYSFYNLED